MHNEIHTGDITADRLVLTGDAQLNNYEAYGHGHSNSFSIGGANYHYAGNSLTVNGASEFQIPPSIQGIQELGLGIPYAGIRFAVDNTGYTNTWEPHYTVDLPTLKKALLETPIESFEDKSLPVESIQFPTAANVNLADVIMYFAHTADDESFERTMSTIFDMSIQTRAATMRKLSRKLEEMTVEASVQDLVE